MPGEAIQIGPFTGGLNTFSDVTSIADNELSVCENFELDLDGSLKSRPPFMDLSIPFTLGATGNLNILGYYYGPGAVPFLLASNGLDNTYYFDGTSWQSIFAAGYANKFSASSMTQFDHKAWLLSPYGDANPGGYWTTTGGFVAEANMPHGNVIVAHKYRLWVAGGRDVLSNPTRLYRSETLADPTFWLASPNFIDIGAGDGESIVKVVVYYNSIVIFRTNSIYSFQYSTDPASGVVSLLVPNIGLSSLKAIVAWENFIYFMYDEKAYEFVNNRAQQINLKVPFEATVRANIYQPYTVSAFNNRIIFSFYDTMFVFSLRTRTWTTWKSPTHDSIGDIIAPDIDSEFEWAYAFSNKSIPTGGARAAKTLRITDTVNTDEEDFTCTLQTKNYTYQTSSAYKRLFWWGIDAIFRGVVRAYAIPVSFSRAITWLEMKSLTWGQAKSNTWAQPTSATFSVETVRNTSGLGATRKFVKFLKSLRFRQVYYRLEFDTDGSISSAPVRLFGLMTYVRAHERVSKTIT